MLKTIKSLLKLGIWTALTIIFGAIITKIIAISSGPVGVGYLSIFRQLQQTFVSVATFTGETALIQGIGAREKSESIKYATNIGALIALSIVFFGIFCFLSFYIFSPDWRERLKTEETTTLYLLLMAAVFASLAAYSNSVLNGNGKVSLTVKLQAAAACAGCILASILSSKTSEFSIASVLLVMAVTGFISSIYHTVKFGYVDISKLSWLTENAKKDVRYFFSISSAAALVGFLGAGTLLLARLMVVDKRGVHGAGLFDAAWTLSTIYLALFLSSFGGYFLPKLSSWKDSAIFNSEINKLLYLSLLVSIALIVPLIYLKSIVFGLFYSSEFSESVQIFRWMLIGDYFKVIGWALSIPMLARAYMRPYLVLSLGWNIFFIAGVYVCLVRGLNIEAIGFVYMVTQALYAAVSFLYWTKCRGLHFPLTLLMLWLSGLLIIVIFSIITWTDKFLTISSASIACVLLAMYYLLGIGAEGRKFLAAMLIKRN